MTAKRPISEARSSDLRGAPAALKRAAERARKIAALTGTAIVVEREGRIELIYPTGRVSALGVQETPGEYNDQNDEE